MKRNRNSFFNEDINLNNQFPYQMNYPYPNPMPNSDFQERLAKIERQINRLEHRLEKLENNLVKSTDDFDSTSNNMYML